MPIIQRDFKAGNFHVANDTPFEDESLSWEAKGVLGYLFAQSKDWTPRIYDIVQHGPCEKHKIKSVFAELEEHGYMHREKYRTEQGTFDWRVTVYDHPRRNPGWSESTPEESHPGSNGGASKTNSEQKLTSNQTNSERNAHAHDDPVDMLREMWNVRPTNFQADKIQSVVDDLDRWETLLETFLMQNKDSKKAIGWVFEDYKNDSVSTGEQKNNLSKYYPDHVDIE